MPTRRLECDNPQCHSYGYVIFDDDGNIDTLRGPFAEQDRKSGGGIVCVECGCEVEGEDTDEVMDNPDRF